MLLTFWLSKLDQIMTWFRAGNTPLNEAIVVWFNDAYKRRPQSLNQKHTIADPRMRVLFNGISLNIIFVICMLSFVK